jgi:hypothetical protein
LPEASELAVIENSYGTIVINMSFIDGIGLYKLAMGYGDDDEDVERVRAALLVQLSGVVGP